MTLSKHVRFDFLSFWQAGSGLGAEAAADSVVARDETGLPYLPGRTVKGLLRDAMDLAAVPRERILLWFGSENMSPRTNEESETDVRLEQSRFTNTPGALWFGSALLPEPWRRWARANPGAEVTAALFRHVASTAIDASGVALDKTLRVAEVAVPMSLRARVSGPADDERWIDDLREALPLLRAAGTRRHRGYGRLRCTLED